ncbi:NAD(P)-binding protein [Schizopora paradoxa]|uniref:NAD(P)-binding protein n=1 Tax=Schizopora paradoxa TaxID=27342 RepID=A0A0H2S0K9_9AGAM|nr:NAD(P)-binding protein [Schizopora paradoxa]
MAITKALTAPLFTVVGATGGQGGSVVRALQASSLQYRVRAITRDASKPAANALKELGCDVLEADVKTADGVKKAFDGADIGFAMTLTDFTSPDFAEKEYAEAVLQIDAAKAAGVKTLVWSGMPHISNISGGKQSVAHFENKANVTTYARSLGGLKVIDVQPGTFFSNFLRHNAPRKLEDGSFVLTMAANPDTKLPVIDIDADYGKYVISALENGSVDTVLAAPEYITPTQVVEAFAKASGKNVSFTCVPDEQLQAILTKVRGEVPAVNMVAMFRAVREVGYYVGADLAPSNKILSTPARKIDEMLAANPKGVAELFA